MSAERKPLRVGTEDLTVLFPTEVKTLVGQYSTYLMRSLYVSSVFTVM